MWACRWAVSHGVHGSAAGTPQPQPRARTAQARRLRSGLLNATARSIVSSMHDRLAAPFVRHGRARHSAATARAAPSERGAATAPSPAAKPSIYSCTTAWPDDGGGRMTAGVAAPNGAGGGMQEGPYQRTNITTVTSITTPPPIIPCCLFACYCVFAICMCVCAHTWSPGTRTHASVRPSSCGVTRFQLRALCEAHGNTTFSSYILVNL